ncbi:hypothetical protein GCM10023192_57300 [Amycolatopsis samaneae]
MFSSSIGSANNAPLATYPHDRHGQLDPRNRRGPRAMASHAFVGTSFMTTTTVTAPASASRQESDSSPYKALAGARRIQAGDHDENRRSPYSSGVGAATRSSTSETSPNTTT